MSIYTNNMNSIKLARKRNRISQRSLAEKASLSFKGLQLLEKHGHDAKLSSIKKVAAALGLPGGGIEWAIQDFFSMNPDSIKAASLRIHSDGFKSWPLHLMNFVDAFRRSLNENLIRSAPMEESDPRLTAIMASMVEFLCMHHEHAVPNWCAGILPLKEPWFVSGIENLKATALVESPVHFRKRNIFVMSDFLDRV